jgi:hypothetical protein
MDIGEKQCQYVPRKNVFPIYNNHLVNKVKQLTRGAPLLNHSLMTAVIRADKQKFISGQAKRGSGSLSDRKSRTICSELWE